MWTTNHATCIRVHQLSLTWILDIFAHINMMITTWIYWFHMVSDLSHMGFNNASSHFEFHIFFTQVSTFTWLHFTHTHFTWFTYTLTHEHIHITHYTFHILGAVTHSPNHQRRTYTHHITHRRHLGIPMATLGLRRPGEQVSTLTSGTCPPPGFPPNALRVT